MNEDISDVTLVTEDKKQIKGNINILSACSPVFISILKKDNNSNTLMYLRGIQYSEMESIMQFIYLGEATFYEERMDEFLAVAKSLEIKELYSAEALTNVEPKNEPSPSDQRPSTDKFEEQISDIVIYKDTQDKDKEEAAVGVNRKMKCDQCHKTFPGRSGLREHRQKHEGVKYGCDQCDYQATQRSDLNRHIQTVHEGACVQCDYQATRQGNLAVHIQSKHEGVRYACDQCDYQATTQQHLTRHINSRHEGVKYSCNQCVYQATRQDRLTAHIKTKHNV